jgi:hypothetical protein
MLWRHVQTICRTTLGSLCGSSSDRRSQLQRPLNPQLQHSSSVSSSTMSRWPSDQPMLAPDHCSSSQTAPALKRIPSELTESVLNERAASFNAVPADRMPAAAQTDIPSLQPEQQQAPLPAVKKRPKPDLPNQQQQHQKQAQKTPSSQRNPQADSAAAAAAVPVDCDVTGTCTLEQVWKQLQQQQQKQQQRLSFGGISSARLRHRSGPYASAGGSRRLSLKATKSSMRTAHR